MTTKKFSPAFVEAVKIAVQTAEQAENTWLALAIQVRKAYKNLPALIAGKEDLCFLMAEYLAQPEKEAYSWTKSSLAKKSKTEKTLRNRTFHKIRDVYFNRVCAYAYPSEYEAMAFDKALERALSAYLKSGKTPTTTGAGKTAAPSVASQAAPTSGASKTAPTTTTTGAVGLESREFLCEKLNSVISGINAIPDSGRKPDYDTVKTVIGLQQVIKGLL